MIVIKTLWHSIISKQKSTWGNSQKETDIRYVVCSSVYVYITGDKDLIRVCANQNKLVKKPSAIYNIRAVLTGTNKCIRSELPLDLVKRKRHVCEIVCLFCTRRRTHSALSIAARNPRHVFTPPPPSLERYSTACVDTHARLRETVQTEKTEIRRDRAGS